MVNHLWQSVLNYAADRNFNIIVFAFTTKFNIFAVENRRNGSYVNKYKNRQEVENESLH